MIFTTRYDLFSISDKLSNFDDNELEQLFQRAYNARETKSYINLINPDDLFVEDVQGLADTAMRALEDHYFVHNAMDSFEIRRQLRASGFNLRLFIEETGMFFLSNPAFIHSLRTIVAVECKFGNLFVTHDRRYELPHVSHRRPRLPR